MSKMDGLRAMREARYAENAARAKSPTPAAKKPAAKKARVTTAEAAEGDLCGHRAISGRTCTREKGHAAKSHRYA